MHSSKVVRNIFRCCENTPCGSDLDLLAVQSIPEYALLPAVCSSTPHEHHNISAKPADSGKSCSSCIRDGPFHAGGVDNLSYFPNKCLQAPVWEVAQVASTLNSASATVTLITLHI